MTIVKSLFRGLLIVLITSLSVSAQTRPAPEAKCTLTLAQAPEIRGLRLGMNLDQVKTIFPRLKLHYLPNLVSESGRATAKKIYITGTVSIAEAVAGSEFQGIQSFSFEFFDDRISNLIVNYDGSTQWKSPDDFAAKISQAFDLPNAWGITPSGDEKSVKCNGFEVIVWINEKHQERIDLVDLVAEQTEKERREEIEEKKRKEFKP